MFPALSRTGLSLLLLGLLAGGGCARAIPDEVPSPVVSRDPRIETFRKKVARFAEESRVATNRLELGLTRSQAELLLDDLKEVCSRIPDPPSPQFQSQYDECFALVRRLEQVTGDLAEVDARHRREAQARRMAERGVTVVFESPAPRSDSSEEPLAARSALVDWVPLEEQSFGIEPLVFDEKAEILRVGLTDLRTRFAHLRDSLPAYEILARGYELRDGAAWTR
jgi:hypothetical protein